MDTKRIKEIFQDIENMAGSSLGLYLKRGGRNTQQLKQIFEDEFTCAALEKLKGDLDTYAEKIEGDIEAMDPEFADQHNQIMAMRESINSTVGDLNHKISNLPNLLEAVVQEQMQSILSCYTKNHTQDYPNMNQSLKLLKEQGFQDTPENRIRFTEIYLKSYFRKVVASSIQTGSYKKYKVAVINRFQERYEEMLAG